MTRPTIAALALLACAALAPPAAAQADGETDSAYGCRMLGQAKPQPLLEGSDGVFYRANLDMRMNHPLAEEAAAMIGALSRTLAERGTRLIYLPVPTKSLAMPGNLPDAAADYGFDVELADIAYRAFLDKLRAEDVVVADSLPALRETDRPFIGTDFHWTTEGARAAAGAVAEEIRALPEYADADKTRHESTAGELRRVSSELRRRIQPYCRDAVPPAETKGFVTEAVGGGDGGDGGEGGGGDGGDAGGGIFAGEGSGPPLALIGTSMSAENHFNFEGFLAEASELSVANYAITGGNQFGSITSYLLSEDFRETPPTFLVWENPIYNNLGEFGSLPLLELQAAAADNCDPVETRRIDDTGLEAALPADRLTRDSFVKVDTGRANGRRVALAFTTADGLTVDAAISRPPRFEPTRWFYQPLATLGHDDLTDVRVTAERAVTDDATLSICNLKGDSS